jgi:hypothetical protein
MNDGSFDLVRWFLEGGWPMYAVAFFGLEGLAMGSLHAALSKRWTRLTFFGALASIFLAGIGGTVLGRVRMEAALKSVDPTMAEQLRQVGEQEASHPIKLAGMVAMLALIPFVIGEVRKGSS